MGKLRSYLGLQNNTWAGNCSLSHNLVLQQCNKTRGHPYKLVKSFCSHDIYKHFYSNRVIDL